MHVVLKSGMVSHKVTTRLDDLEMKITVRLDLSRKKAKKNDAG